MMKWGMFTKDGEVNNGEVQNLDVEHELPAAEDQGQEVTGAETAALEDELAKVTRERDALLDRMARMQADFDNARKRVQREQQEHRDYALTDAVRALLPILDSFDRAIVTSGSGDDLRKGVELINRQLHDALSKLGVEPVEAQGAPFDPNVHEALGVVETSDVPANHVADELQRGYKLKGRLLRPAMVRVAKNG
jgi:molecular chaperone GrpE